MDHMRTDTVLQNPKIKKDMTKTRALASQEEWVMLYHGIDQDGIW